MQTTQVRTLLDVRRAVIEALRAEAKKVGYSALAHDCCTRCGIPYALDPAHAVKLDPMVAFFYLCETCWRMTDHAERLEAMRRVYTHAWKGDERLPLVRYEEALAAAEPRMEALAFSEDYLFRDLHGATWRVHPTGDARMPLAIDRQDQR